MVSSNWPVARPSGSMTFKQQSGIVVAVFKNKIFYTYFGQAFVSVTVKEKKYH
jgi:hypothetical protein